MTAPPRPLRSGRIRQLVAPLVAGTLTLALPAVLPTATSAAASGGAEAMTWDLKAPDTSPPATVDGAMAYDPVLGEDILFGGRNTDGDDSSDTWGWNGTTWTLLDTTGPAPRAYEHMAYDPRTQNIVLFGGQTTTTGPACEDGCDDTWTFNGTWTQAQPAVSPPAIGFPVMAYDPADGDVVLTGGTTTNAEGDGQANAYTWFWNGTNWRSTHHAPDTAVGGVALPAMSYDPATKQLIFFGGEEAEPNSAGLPEFSDTTWVLDGGNWTLLTPTTSPPGTYTAVSDYSRYAGGIILFGGSVQDGTSNTFTNATWLFDGTNWTQLATPRTPHPTIDAQMAPDPHGQLLLFGGTIFSPTVPNQGEDTNHTWLFKPA